MSSCTMVHPNSMSRFYKKILSSGPWCHTACHNTSVVDQQLVLPDYWHCGIFFIHGTIRRIIHENTRRNDRSTWIIVQVQEYIDIYKMYIRSHTRVTFLVQVIHQYNYPQGRIQKMKYWSLSTINNKLTRYCNCHSIRRWHTGNWRQTSIDECDWMHQEIICYLINGWTRELFRMYNQAWPHQDEPQYLSTGYNYQDDSRI